MVNHVNLSPYMKIRLTKKTEAILRHTQKMESLGSSAGGMAHDINNMLVPIINLTSSVETTQSFITKKLANIEKDAKKRWQEFW